MAFSASTALLYHPTISHYLRYISTVLGRDKLLGLLQYLSRFYAWYLLRRRGDPLTLTSLATLKTQVGLARKLLRAGRNVEHLKAAAVARDSPSLNAVVRWCAVGRHLGYAGYMSADMVSLKADLGFGRAWAKGRREWWARTAGLCWVLGLGCSVTGGCWRLWDLKTQELRLDRGDAEGKVVGKRIEK